VSKIVMRPLMGAFEKSFQDEAFNILQKGLLKSGIRIVITKSPEICETLSKIGMEYHCRVPDEF